MKTQGWGVETIAGFGILAAWFVACAGSDIPPVDDELRGALITNFGGQDGQLGGGASGAGGDGGDGGSASGAAGAGGDGGAAGAAGAGGSAPVGGGGSGSSADVCDAYETVFLVKCGTSGCHGDGAINGVFAGAAAPTADDIVDQPSTRGDACGVLVDPGNTDDSLILTMVLGEQPASCFPVQMPLGGDNLLPEEIDCVTEWLTQFED